MESERPLVIFSLEGRRYALDLPRVSRVVRAVAVTPLPGAPAIVSGLIDLGGAVVPVVNLRERFNLPARPVQLTDQFVIASTGRRTVALRVDASHGVIDGAPEAIVPGDGILPGLGLVDGAVKRPDGLILIHDLGRLLSLDDEATLARALASPPAPVSEIPDDERDRTVRILEARARKLARSSPPADAAEWLEILMFSLGSETYGVETRFVREVCPLRDLTPLPGTPPLLAGVMNLRGRILAIIDLRKFFGLPIQGLTELNRVIVLADGDDELGLLADAVDGVRPLARVDLQDGLPTLTGVRERYLAGVTGKMLALLDGARLLSDDELRVNATVTR